MGYSDSAQKYGVVWVFPKVCNSYVMFAAEVKSKFFSFFIGVFYIVTWSMVLI